MQIDSVHSNPPRRRLGQSDLWVSPVALGCWPIAGVSSLGVNDDDSLATIHAALDAGINFFDTAYSYGYDGQADLLLAQVLRKRGAEMIVASKVGTHYDAQQRQVVDGRPATLLEHARRGCERLGVEQLDVIYLHAVDPQVPLAESAGAIAEILKQGLARYAGVSNVDPQQLTAFTAVCPVIIVQPPFNMLQIEKVQAIIPQCVDQQIAIAAYWVLMKGVLAGRMTREYRLDPADRRLNYPVYQGAAWQRTHDLLDRLRPLAAGLNCTLAQLVIAWTLAQPGLTVALCGAKRPEQIQESAGAMQVELSPNVLEQIDGWLVELNIASDTT